MRNCGTGLGGALGTESRLELQQNDVPKPDGSPGGGREEYHEEREPDSDLYERTAGVVSNCAGDLSRFKLRDGVEGGAEVDDATSEQSCKRVVEDGFEDKLVGREHEVHV